MTTKHDAKSTKLRAELMSLSGSYGMLRVMLRHNAPLTRDNYIALNWGAHPPDPWTSEQEEELPEPFRKHQDKD